MNEKKNCNNFQLYIRNSQIIIAGFVAVLALLISLSVLFSHDAVGMMDYGEYTQTLYDMGISYTDSTIQDESLYFSRVIEQYRVDSVQYLKLLQLVPSQSMIYPVSVISIICSVLKIAFSTRYLVFLLLLITVSCIYSITKSAYVFLKDKAAAVGVLCCFVLLCGNYIIYFNSLYRNGTYYVSFLSYLTILLHIVARNGKVSNKSVLLLIFISLMLLNSKEITIVYLPVVILADIWAIIYCRPEKRRQISYYLLNGLLLVFVVRSNILYTMQNEALFSNAQLYQSFFDGALEESDNPSELLTELGIDPKLQDDIGKSVYLKDSEYVLSPNEEEAKKAIFSHLNYQVLQKLYLEHPDIYGKVLQTTAENLKKIDTSKFLYVNRNAGEGTEWVERFVWWQWVRNLIVPGKLSGYVAIASITLFLILFLLVRCRKKGGKRGVVYLFAIFWMLALIQFMTLYAWQGYAEMVANSYYFILPYDVLLIFIVGIGIYIFDSARIKFREICP